MQPAKKVKRQKEILNIVRNHKQISTADLNEMVDVSYPTLCRDLRELESLKKIEHLHGNVRIVSPEKINNINVLTPHTKAVSDYYLYDTRMQLNQVEKYAIGKKAASLLEPNDIIYISHGTTTAAFARAIDPNLSLTVITDGLDIINIFKGHPNVRLYTTGGAMNYNSMQIEHNPYISCDISYINMAKIFIGIGGFSFSTGLTFYDFNSFEFLKQIINSDRELIVLADSTKFESVALANFITTDQISMLITDWNVDVETIKKLEAIHVPYLIAEKPAD